MGNRRRVVVTGMGVLAPNGTGLQAFWESLLTGKSGIGAKSRFSILRGIRVGLRGR